MLLIGASEKLRNADQVQGKVVVVHRDSPQLVIEHKATSIAEKARNVMEVHTKQ